MAVFKRYKGKRISPDDPNWSKAKWWMEFTLRGRYILQSVTAARTKAQAERAEHSIKDDIYNGRYDKAALTAKFTDFVDKQFLPWSETNKLSWKDDKRRCEVLKDFFGNQPMREINPLTVERF